MLTEIQRPIRTLALRDSRLRSAMLENPPPPEESNRPDRIPSTNRHWIQNGLKAAFIGALYISVIAVTLIFSITSPELLFLIMIIFLGIYVVYTSKIVRRLFASQ